MIDYSQPARYTGIEKPSYRRGWGLKSAASQNLWPQHESSGGGGSALFVENATSTTTEETEQGRIGEHVEKCAIKSWFSSFFSFLLWVFFKKKIWLDDEIDNSNHPCTCTL